MTGRLFYFDLETYLFGPGNMAPKPVSIAWKDNLGGRELALADQIPRILGPVLESAIQNRTTVLCGHNVAYDFCCVLRWYPELAGLIWEAYDKSLVTDSQVREHLLDIAAGELRGAWKHGRFVEYSYDLASCVERRVGSKMKKGEDTYRKRYAELDGLPVAQWPRNAVDYALGDVDEGLALTLSQEKRGQELGYTLPTQWDDARAALALRLTSNRGIMTHPERVKALHHATQKRMLELGDILCMQGLGRWASLGAQTQLWGEPQEKKLQTNMRAVRDRVEATFVGKKIPMTDGGKSGVKQIKTDRATIELCYDDGLTALVEFNALRKTGSAYVRRMFDGFDLPIHASFGATGAGTNRTRSWDPNMQNQPRLPGVRECFVPRDGFVFVPCDFDTQEMRTWAQACVDLGIPSRMATMYREDPRFDPHQQFADEHFRGVEDGRQRAKACFHPDTEILTKKRGWVRVADLTYTDEVAAAYPQKHGESVLRWEPPIALTKRKAPDGELIHLKNEGMDLRVTADHRMVGFRANGTPYVTSPEKLALARRWGNAGDMSGGKIPGGPIKRWDLLRLAVATQADGSYARNQIRFGFTKKRKIARLGAMLEPWEGQYVRKTKGRVTTFTIRPYLSCEIRKLLNDDKTLPVWWINLPTPMRETILDELPHWDGSWVKGRRRFQYSSICRQNVDVVQAIAVITGRKARVTMEAGKDPRHSTIWYVSVGDHAYSRGGNLTATKRRYTGDVVCLSVPSSFVLVRDRGVSVVVGQCNFGFPGGLGWEKFLAYAKGYGVVLSPDEAKNAKHGWQKTWSEEKAWFAHIRGIIGNRGYGRLVVPRTGFVRDNVGYCDGANTGFQHLAAQASKRALWLVTRACYDPRLTINNPLRGSYPVNFIHDEILLEAPEEGGHEAAMATKALMEEGIRPFTPDVAARATPSLCRAWSKGAKPVYEKGRLVPWEAKTA